MYTYWSRAIATKHKYGAYLRTGRRLVYKAAAKRAP